MKLKSIIFIVAGLLILTVNDTKAQDLTATEIIQKATDKLNGESSKGTMKMTVVSVQWGNALFPGVWNQLGVFWTRNGYAMPFLHQAVCRFNGPPLSSSPWFESIQIKNIHVLCLYFK